MEDDLLDQHFFDSYNSHESYETCYRCGEEDLQWDYQQGEWRLVDDIGERHVCPPTAEGFEKLP